jgi:hypothetical protein
VTDTVWGPPLVGIPLIEALALNQMKSPPGIEVPLKFEAIDDDCRRVHALGGPPELPPVLQVETSLVSSVTAPFSAKTPPDSFAPVVKVSLATAIMTPWN